MYMVYSVEKLIKEKEYLTDEQKKMVIAELEECKYAYSRAISEILGKYDIKGWEQWDIIDGLIPDSMLSEHDY